MAYEEEKYNLVFHEEDSEPIESTEDHILEGFALA